MYVAIRWYGPVADSPEDVGQDGRELAAVLAKAPGFISFALLEADDGAFASIGVFETKAALDAAERLIDRWAAASEGRKLPPTVRLTNGEVIAQKGI